MCMTPPRSHPGLELPCDARRGARSERPSHDDQAIRRPGHCLREVQENRPHSRVQAGKNNGESQKQGQRHMKMYADIRYKSTWC